MKSKYTCIAIDDDALFLEIFEFIAQQADSLELKETYTTWNDGIVGLKKFQPDILFLDVELPDLIIANLTTDLASQPKIVMISAHVRYDVNKLNFKVAKFVSKPIRDSQHLDLIAQEVMETQ
jgi:two-component SAPR family response regulator